MMMTHKLWEWREVPVGLDNSHVLTKMAKEEVRQQQYFQLGLCLCLFLFPCSFPLTPPPIFSFLFFPDTWFSLFTLVSLPFCLVPWTNISSSSCLWLSVPGRNTVNGLFSTRAYSPMFGFTSTYLVFCFCVHCLWCPSLVVLIIVFTSTMNVELVSALLFYLNRSLFVWLFTTTCLNSEGSSFMFCVICLLGGVCTLHIK